MQKVAAARPVSAPTAAPAIAPTAPPFPRGAGVGARVGAPFVPVGGGAALEEGKEMPVEVGVEERD